MNQLVQIHLNGLPKSSALLPAPPRIKEYTLLVDAISRMLGRVGMHGVCRLCFKGHLGREQGRGCCGFCPNLGHQSCLDKPLGCARFMCWTTMLMFPETRDLLMDALQATVPTGCYPTGVAWEAQHGPKLSEAQLKSLRVARWAVENWAV